MDKISAQNLIKETFNYPFNEEKFSKFLRNEISYVFLLELIESLKNHDFAKSIFASNFFSIEYFLFK